MASTVIKNWDNKTWLAAQNYINKFNKFLLKNIKLNSKSLILDIGCGRGKILGSLSSKLKLKTLTSSIIKSKLDPIFIFVGIKFFCPPSSYFNLGPIFDILNPCRNLATFFLNLKVYLLIYKK